MHNAIAAALDSISLGPSIIVDNLTMIPLIQEHPNSADPRTTDVDPRAPRLAPRASHLDYAVLDDALSSGAAEITEVSEQGSVPDLMFLNRGAAPVLIVDGEELLGAKQNRVVNLSILVAANSELTIPVSCVEAGRWRARSRSFTSAPRTQYATGRARRMKDVSFSMMARGERMSDQAEVWHHIAQKSARLDARSVTSAMEAIFDAHATSLQTFVDGCQPVEGQVGALFAVGPTLIGFDLFDRPSTLRKMLPKLVRSVAVDALDASLPRHESGGADEPGDFCILRAPASGRTPAHDQVVRAQAAQFLAVTAGAPQHVTKALGLGEDARLTTPHIAGAALVADQHVVHLSAFAL